MRYFILALLACAAIAACGNPLGITAYITNVVDTVHLYALSGTPVSLPSGYSIINQAQHVVRTDQGQPFDFAFDIDTTGRSKILPTGAMKLGKQSGLQVSGQQFDSIKIAPTTGYNLDSAQAVNVNTVLILHSATFTCPFGLPGVLYAKLRVLDIDTTSAPNGRRITFEILNDQNCGYRGLQPGVPRN
jgi:hypothetical protein